MHALTTHSRAPLAAGCLVASMVALAVVVAPFRWGVAGIAVAVGLVPATVAAFVDLGAARLPNRLVLAVSAPAGLVVFHQALTGSAIDVVGAATAGVVLLAGPLLALHLISPDSIGFGDVKLAAALGVMLGLADPRACLVALCVASGTTAAIGLAIRRSTMPLGPGLVAGAATALLLASILGGTALPWR